MDLSRMTEEQRRAVQSREKSIAVSAAAGSGKTTVLTNRILDKICSSGGDLSRMLVVTFTRAAAKNLSVKIRAAIEKELLSDPHNAHLYRQLLLVPCAKISTVHGFCLDLIRANFQRLGLSTDVRTADEATEAGLRDDVFADLIAAYYESEIGDEYAIADFPSFVSLFGSETDETALPANAWEYYLFFQKWPEGLDALDAFIQEYKNAETLDFMRTIWGSVLARTARETVAHYRAVYEKALSFIATHEKCEKYEEPFTDDYHFLCSFDPGREEYAYYAGFFAAYAQPSLGSQRANRDPEMLYYLDERAELKKEMKKLSDVFSFKEADIPAAAEKTAAALCDLKRFLTLFDLRFSEEKRRRRLITFDDMERMTLTLLWDREHDAPTEIALAVRDEFDEVFVDEYQDTNAVQDKIFSLISKENNRFVVGDLKQSIYGFRGARPDLFEKTLAACSPIETEKETENPRVKVFLSKNFRSQSRILDYANEVFRVLMNAGDRPYYGEKEELVCGTGMTGAPVEIKVLPKEKMPDGTTRESEYTAAKIAELLQTKKADGKPVCPGDIAILLRDKKDCADSFMLSLKKRGIPCESATKELFETPEVLLALSLFHTVDNPSHDIHLAAVLKSPLYGMTLDELLYMRRQTPEGTLYDALCAFSAAGSAKGKRFLADHARMRALSAVLPCDRLIWRLYGETGLLCLAFDDGEKPNGAEIARANLMQLYRWSMNFSDSSTGGLHAFLAFIDQTIESETKLKEIHTSSMTDAVSLMTIHESKGLEFPICFLCQSQKDFSTTDTKKPVILDEKTGVAMKLLSENGLVRWQTPFAEAAARSVTEVQRAEETRLLYVALTRAVEQLYITAGVKESEKKPITVRYGTEETEKRPFAKRDFSFHSLIRAKNHLDLLLTGSPASPSFTFSLVTEAAEEETAPVGEERQTFLPVEVDHALERLSFRYPDEALTVIPSKLSVSRLYPDVLNEHDTAQTLEEPSASVKVPRFLQSEPDETVTAAERGTAMHTFMQFFDFAFVDAHGVKAEIERLISLGFLFPSDREKLNVRKLEHFFAGQTADCMRKAVRLYREKRFLVNFPAERFTEDEEQKSRFAGQTLLVQGVMDCVLFDENGELILIDYKTDSFAKDADPDTVRQTLCERHARQLGYYRYACEKLYHQKVAHTWIYSFALGDRVEVPE